MVKTGTGTRQMNSEMEEFKKVKAEAKKLIEELKSREAILDKVE